MSWGYHIKDSSVHIFYRRALERYPKPCLIMIEVSVDFLINLNKFNLLLSWYFKGVHLYIALSSRYVLPLQTDENLKGIVYRWHGGTPLRALG
jgi:hypothetical protein